MRFLQVICSFLTAASTVAAAGLRPAAPTLPPSSNPRSSSTSPSTTSLLTHRQTLETDSPVTSPTTSSPALPCNCSPREISFKLNLSATCSDVLFEGGAELDSCAITNEDDLDLVPIKIDMISVLEFSSNPNTTLLKQEYLDGVYGMRDGGVFNYASVSDVESDLLTKVPGRLQLIIFGANEDDAEVETSILIDYTLECGVPTFREGDHVGWVIFDSLVSSWNEECGYPSSSPTSLPTLSPLPTYQPSLEHSLLPTDSPVTLPTTNSPVCYSGVNKIRLESTTTEQIQMFEVYALSSGGNVALNKNASQSSTWKNNDEKFGAFNSVDGVNSSFSHTNDTNAYWEVNLGGSFDLESVTIANRYCKDESDATQCLCKLSNASLILIDNNDSILSERRIGNTCGELLVHESFTSCTTSPTAVPSLSPSTPPMSPSHLPSASISPTFASCDILDACIDGNLCTIDTAEFENDEWVCKFENVVCQEGFMCNPRDGSCINRQMKLTSSDGEDFDQFGFSLSVHKDMLVVGAPQDDEDRGSAYLFVFNETSGDWIQTAKLNASDGAKGHEFAWNVAASEERIVIGSRRDEDIAGMGCAYVFEFNGTNWIEVAKLHSNDGEVYDWFGSAVDVSGEVIIVGARYHQSRTGAAYIFHKDPNSSEWFQKAKLLSSDGSRYDYFGYAVAIYDDIAVVGSSSDEHENITGTGSVHVFESWGQRTKLIPSDGSNFEGFGISVAIDGYTIAVGSPFDNTLRGSVYIFEKDTPSGSWLQTDKIQADVRERHDRFGWSVDIDGDKLVVGASAAQNLQGVAYLFQRNVTSGGWFQVNKIMAYDGFQDNNLHLFGSSIGVSGDIVVVGSPYNQSGSAYSVNLTEYSTEHEEKSVLDDSCVPSDVHFVRLESTTADIQMFGLEAYTPSGMDVALKKNASQSSTYQDNNDKFGAANAVDGIGSSFCHTNDANAYWEVDLGNAFNISHISIQNRYCKNTSDDQGCLCRLTNATTSLLDSHGEVISSTNFKNTFDYAKRHAKKVRLQSVTGEPLQLFELQAYSSGTDVAVNSYAVQSSTYLNNSKYAAFKSIDGVNTTFSHTDTADRSAYLEITFTNSFVIDSVVILNRWCKEISDPNGCMCRLSSATLTLLDEKNHVIGTKVIGNTCGVLFVEEKFSCPTCGILDGCHDGDMCTRDVLEYENDEWVCKYKNDVVCQEGWACDASDGICKSRQTKLTPGDDAFRFGTSVAASDNIFIVGMHRYNSSIGSASIYELDEESGEWFLATVLSNPNPHENDKFGLDCDIHGDVVIIGTPGYNQEFGAVYVYRRNITRSWELVNMLTPSDGSTDYYGRSVAIFQNTIVVGAPNHSSSTGAAYIYEQESGNWTETIIVANDAQPSDRFGLSLDVSGTHVVVGTTDQNDARGAVYIFEKMSGNWIQTAKLTPSDSQEGDEFGASVSTNGNTVLVGGPEKNNETGSAYIFEKDISSGNWTQFLLQYDDGESGDHFGWAVDVLGNTAVVAAFKDDNNTGAVLLYVKDVTTGNWSQTTRFTADDGQSDDSYGRDVSISGQIIVVGAPGEDGNDNDCNRCGAVYVIV